MKVKDLMTKNFIEVSPKMNVTEVAIKMDEHATGSVIVEENKIPVGIMTERDILRKIVAKNKNANEVLVEEIMTLKLITIDIDEDVEEAARIMDENRIRRLMVTENGKMVGKITANVISRNFKYVLGSRLTEHYKPDYTIKR